MSLKIYNSISGTKETFLPIIEGRVGMYVCGPTVYNDVHIGNCRTFVSFDVIYRYLMYLGYKVRYVRNITDVGHLEGDVDSNAEDKISKKANVAENKIRNVELYENFSFVSVPFKEAEVIIDAFEVERTGKKPLIEKANEKKKR